MFMASSPGEDVLQPFDGRLAADLADGMGQRDLLGADLDAVLRVAAGGHAARAHERVETVVLVELAGGVEVHEERLADGGGADEAGARRVVAVDLGADLEAASAGDTAIEGVADPLQLGRQARAGAEVVGAVERDPDAQPPERLEHPAP